MDFDWGNSASDPLAAYIKPEPPDHPELWERLISGNFARIVLLCPRDGLLESSFPQALGLRPMSAFRYRVQGSLATAAGQLAAADHWIAEGERWTRYFLPRADIIISIEIPLTAHTTGHRQGATGVGRWLRQARVYQRRRKAARSGGSVLDIAADRCPRGAEAVIKTPTLAIAEDQYADKLIRVTTRDQVRALRKVRADEN